MIHPYLCTEGDSDIFQSLMSFCIWIIILDGFDIAYAMFAMIRFNMLPREENLTDIKSILAYLKIFPKGKVIFDPSHPNHSV
jgi:hypothetical protein